MKKFARWIPGILLALCCAAFAAYCLLLNVSVDRTAPVIHMKSDTLSTSVHKDQNALLAGVTAADDRDGDVTASLLVESISAMDDDHCVTVTYAAFDSSGNVAKARRTVRYTDYEGPKFALNTPLVFYGGYMIDLLDHITAHDPVDGDLSHQIKATLVGGSGDLSEVGTHQVELRVTNSMDDTVHLTVPVQVLDASKDNAVVNLSEYLLYWKQGQPFQPQDYLTGLYAGYQEIPLSKLNQDGADIRIESDVNPDVPGTYSVSYTINYDGYTGTSRLIVIVED